MAQVIIVSPSLNTSDNVSGISSVTQFIINNNKQYEYIHFELGKKDIEKGGIYRVKAIVNKLFEWYRILKKYPNAIIHYNFPLSKSSILRDPLFMFIAEYKKRKMVVHLHGGNFMSSSYIPILFYSILKRVFAMHYPFIVLSELEKRILESKFNCRYTFVISNCVDLIDAAQYNRIIKKEGELLTLGYLGRIAETKGMNYLLEACKILKMQNIPFILRIAGKEEITNQYLPIFSKELGECFVYDGVISGREKDFFLKRLDIFILPSFFEGLPISLLECMSYGIVPVTTKVGSIGEVVKDNINGLYIQVKDIQSIVKQITMLNSNRILLKNLSIEAKRTIWDKFNPTKYINQLNVIYQSLVSDPKWRID